MEANAFIPIVQEAEDSRVYFIFFIIYLFIYFLTAGFI